MTETPLRIGGRYDLGEVLGRGGMADVRRARDSVLGRDVAVKLLRTTDEVDRTRFDTEARLLALLSHENVVTVLDAGVDDGLAWLALELVEGHTLGDRYRQGPLEPALLADVGAQVAAALSHAHAQGVVHRDVKPSNVLVDGTGRARLTDFGIARLVEDQSALTLTGHAVGTAAYIAPEQVAGEPVTTASDVYALGLLLLEGLTGRREYPGPPVEAALARLQRGPLVPVSLPTGWPSLVSAMTARRPEERPTADAVVQRLRSLGQTAVPPVADAAATTVLPVVPGPAPAAVPSAVPSAVPVGAVAATDPAPTRRRRPRGALVLGAVAASVALVLGAATLVSGGTSRDDAPVDAGVPTATSTTSSSPAAAPVARTTTAATTPTTPTTSAATPDPVPVTTAEVEIEDPAPQADEPDRTKPGKPDKADKPDKATDPQGGGKGGTKGGTKGPGKP